MNNMILMNGMSFMLGGGSMWGRNALRPHRCF